MLVRALYVSRAVGPVTTTVTAAILASARRHNSPAGITGVLCQGSGLYLQVLEGERAAVNRLYASIISDKRHQDVELLSFEEISQRRFGAWSMALVELSASDPMVLLNHPEFDPYAASSSGAMALLDDLLKAGSPIDTPPPKTKPESDQPQATSELPAGHARLARTSMSWAARTSDLSCSVNSALSCMKGVLVLTA